MKFTPSIFKRNEISAFKFMVDSTVMAPNRFIFFTHTNWSEPPRLRHQLATLLVNKGHQVIFFERPKFFLKGKYRSDQRHSNLIYFLRSNFLIHHQLRVFIFLQKINELFEIFQIKNKIKEIGIKESDIIINFNYDYYFLRKLFKNNKIVLVLNDDFVSQARLNSGRHVKKSLVKASVSSDHVLTVSPYISDQVSNFCNPELLLPWSDAAHVTKSLFSHASNNVLWWGFFDDRISRSMIQRVAELDHRLVFHFCGPMSEGAKKNMLARLGRCRCVFHKSKNLSDLSEKFLFSMQFYDPSTKFSRGVYVTNKTFRLMEYGLPSIVTGLNYFIDLSGVYSAATEADILNLIAKLRGTSGSEMVQLINKTLRSHNAAKRYQQIQSYI